jgi:hypothetical protein
MFIPVNSKSFVSSHIYLCELQPNLYRKIYQSFMINKVPFVKICYFYRLKTRVNEFGIQ